MSKRITLNKLISYALASHNFNGNDFTESASDNDLGTNSNNNSNDNNEYDLTVNNNMEDIAFKQLIFGESSNITDLPKNLKSMFDPFIKNISRYGIKSEDAISNKSLISSVLYCIWNNFLDLEEDEKIQLTSKLNKKLIGDVVNGDLFDEYGYKKQGWIKKELRESITNYRNNKMVLQVLSDYLHINIFLLNVSEDKLYAIYSEELFNMFKMNLFITHNDGHFEPLCYNNNKLWRFDDEPLKKLINVEKQKINVMNVDFKSAGEERVFQVGSEDLDKYMDNDEENDEENKIVISKDGDKENEENNYDELFTNSENAESSHHENVYINDPEETEIDVESVKNDKDIFCTQKYIEEKKSKSKPSKKNKRKPSKSKPSKKSKSKSDKSESKSKSKSKKAKPDYSDLDNINTRMVVGDLRKLAEKYKIDVENGITKTGKTKYKTKQELYDELVSLRDN
jgi:hypothetical protein